MTTINTAASNLYSSLKDSSNSAASQSNTSALLDAMTGSKSVVQATKTAAESSYTLDLSPEAQQFLSQTGSVRAEVSLNQEEGKGYFISAVLNTEIGGVDDATAQKLTEEAHKMCPYSKATKGNIDVQLNAKGTGAKAAA